MDPSTEYFSSNSASTQELPDSTYQKLLNEGYSEEQIRLIIELGLFPAEEAINKRETEMATKLRDTEAPTGRYVSSGRIYTASSPMEAAGGIAQVYAGNRMQDEIDERARDIAQQQVDRRLAFLNPSRSRTRPLMPAAPGTMAAAPGTIPSLATPGGSLPVYSNTNNSVYGQFGTPPAVTTPFPMNNLPAPTNLPVSRY